MNLRKMKKKEHTDSGNILNSREDVIVYELVKGIVGITEFFTFSLFE